MLAHPSKEAGTSWYLERALGTGTGVSAGAVVVNPTPDKIKRQQLALNKNKSIRWVLMSVLAFGGGLTRNGPDTFDFGIDGTPEPKTVIQSLEDKLYTCWDVDGFRLPGASTIHQEDYEALPDSPKTFVLSRRMARGPARSDNNDTPGETPSLPDPAALPARLIANIPKKVPVSESQARSSPRAKPKSKPKQRPSTARQPLPPPREVPKARRLPKRPAETDAKDDSVSKRQRLAGGLASLETRKSRRLSGSQTQAQAPPPPPVAQYPGLTLQMVTRGIRHVGRFKGM